MTVMTKALTALAVLTALLSGCAPSTAASTPPTATPAQDGGDGLFSFYQNLINPKPDDACHPKDLAGLLTPCEVTMDIHNGVPMVRQLPYIDPNAPGMTREGN
jgi:hypothetical protein